MVLWLPLCLVSSSRARDLAGGQGVKNYLLWMKGSSRILSDALLCMAIYVAPPGRIEVLLCEQLKFFSFRTIVILNKVEQLNIYFWVHLTITFIYFLILFLFNLNREYERLKCLKEICDTRAKCRNVKTTLYMIYM